MEGLKRRLKRLEVTENREIEDIMCLFAHLYGYEMVKSMYGEIEAKRATEVAKSHGWSVDMGEGED